jgi:hypothetical protein
VHNKPQFCVDLDPWVRRTVSQQFEVAGYPAVERIETGTPDKVNSSQSAAESAVLGAIWQSVAAEACHFTAFSASSDKGRDGGWSKV